MQDRREAPTRRVALAVVAALWLWAGTAHAQEGPPDETERWVPSFSLRSGVTAQNYTGSIDSLVVRHFEDEQNLFPLPDTAFSDMWGNMLALRITPREAPRSTITFYDTPNAGGFLRYVESVFKPAQDSATVMNPWVGGSIELMSPGLQSLPTRPRFFIHGDYQRVFGTPRSLARDGAPNPPPDTRLPNGFQLRRDPLSTQPEGFGVQAADPGDPDFDPNYPTGTLLFPVASGNEFASYKIIKGQGSKVLVTEDPNVWGGGAGVAFTFELFGRRLRVKPSVEYQHRKLNIQTVANRAIPSNFQGENIVNPDGTTRVDPPVFNVIQLFAQDELEIHGLGPGLEIEMDTWQVGPVMLSLFISGQAYMTLGDTTVNATGNPSDPCPDTPDGSNLQALCQQIRDFDAQNVPSFFGPVDTSRQRFPECDNIQIVGNTGFLPCQQLSGAGVNDVYGDFGFEIDPWAFQAGIGLRFRGVPDYWIPHTLRDMEMPKIAKPSWLPW